jgi:tetratricopeptide (TPR) repeat protein/DNA-binding CsgD family transcriptional regulator
LNKFNFIFVIAFIASFLVTKAQEMTPLMDSITAAGNLVFSNPTAAKIKLDRLKSQLKSDLREESYEYYRSLGIYYAITADLNEALVTFKMAEPFAQTNKQKTTAIIDISIIYKDLKQYEFAIQELRKAEKLALSMNDTIPLIRIYSNKASIYKNQDLLDLALEYSFKAIKIIEKTPGKEYDLHIEKQKLGNIYTSLKDYDFAIREFETILPFFIQRNDLYTTAIIYLSYAEALYESKKYAQSFEMNKKAVSIFRDIKNDNLLSLTLSLDAKLRNQLNYPKAQVQLIFNSALNLSEGAGKQYQLEILLSYLELLNQENLTMVFQAVYAKYNTVLNDKNLSLQQKVQWNEILYQYFVKTANKNQIIRTADLLLKLKDSLYESQNNKQLKLLQIEYKSEVILKNNEVLNAENKLLLRQNQEKIYLLVFIFLIAASIIIIIVLILRNKTLNEKRLKFKNKILEGENLLKQKNLELKSQLLESYKNAIVQIASKETKLNEALGEIENSMDKKEFKKIMDTIQLADNQLESKQNILDKIISFDADFVKKLQKMHPDLTKAEIEFCLLTRLNLTTKEMAEILRITQKGVFMKRYRLLKKIQLDEDSNLLNYLLLLKAL